MEARSRDQYPYDAVIVAPNAAVDSYYLLSQLDRREVNRAQQVWHTAGGKGNNMARALARLGGRPLSLGIVGGSSGQLVCDDLQRECIAFDVVRVSQETRRCNTLAVQGESQPTIVLEPGAAVGQAAQIALIEKVQQHFSSAPFVAFTGSLLPDFPASYYADLIRQARQAGVRTALDCSGEALKLAAEVAPNIIKVNLHEFQSAFAPDQAWDWEIAAAAFSRWQRRGMDMLIITDGPRGAVVYEAGSAPFRVFTDVRTVVSTAGAGDTFLAGLLLALVRGYDRHMAVRRAAAAAAASLKHIICGALDLNDVEQQVAAITDETPFTRREWHEPTAR